MTQHDRRPELSVPAHQGRDALRAILTSMSEGVYSTDRHGTIVWLNAAAERLSGRRAADVIGRHYREALALEDATPGSGPEATTPLECCMASRCPIYRPLVYLTRPDGRRVPIALSTSPMLDPLGSPASCVAVFRDLSREREVEELQASLVSVLSHELRMPLTAVTMALQLLLKEAAGFSPRQQRLLDAIDANCRRLTSLVSDLLETSRLESGRFDRRLRRRLPLAAVVAEGLDRARGTLGDRTVLVDVPADLPPVWVEAAQMERVVANLLENAAKYGPADRPIQISARRSHGELELRVEDEGPGIPPEHLERVFDKFFRLTRSEQATVPGTGLGLAICRGIVRAHGGRIWAENRPGGGARLVVRLPQAPATSSDTAFDSHA